MEMESKEERMEGVESFQLTAPASSPSEEERKEIPAAAAETGQLHTSDGNLTTIYYYLHSCCCMRLCDVHACMQVRRGFSWVLLRGRTPAAGLPVSSAASGCRDARGSYINMVQERFARPATISKLVIKLH
jgi:hypothetical protein